MKKKTKVNKKKLDSLLLILLLTAVLMVMSTYAWFTANRTVSVEGFNVNVSTTSGLQISADGEDWKTVLTLDDLQKAANAYGPSGIILNQLPVSMEPISSALELDDNGRMKMFYGSTTQEEEGERKGEFYLTAPQESEKGYHLTSGTESAKPEGYYLAFDIFLKSGGNEPKLNMSGSVQELKNNVVITDFDKEKGITNAARVALVVGEHTKSEDGGEIRDLKTNKKVLLWEPNADYHTQKGIDNGVELGILTKDQFTANTMNQAILPCDGVKNPITDSDGKIYLKDATAAKYGNKFETVVPYWTSTKNETIAELPMPAYTYESATETNALLGGVTKFRVYMWIEGQDIDCENYASGSDMQFDLSFSLGEVATN